MGTDEMARANLLVGYNQDGFYGTVSLNAYEVAFDAQYVNIWATKGATINGYGIVTGGNISSFLSDYVKRTNNGFSQCTGDPSSMVCILNGELRYITKSTIKSWLGIS